ncbi:mechanosensitive ion channel family protein [Limibacter armeniacum]|uniref:mechanosensitive ion channel family protein n=1 Tax=Limibacter armeniacum TaxID=466084 RepID=UPI002FE50421
MHTRQCHTLAPYFLGLFLLFTFHFGFTQEKSDEFSTETPYKTVKTHISAFKNKKIRPDLAAKTMGGNLPESQKAVLAEKLYEIYEKLGGVDMSAIPDNKNFENADKEKKYVIRTEFPEIYLIRDRKQWLYAPSSVKQISLLYQRYVVNARKKKSKDRPVAVDTVVYNLSSPYHTVSTFRYYIHDKHYDEERLASLFIAPDLTVKEKAKVGEKLKEIYYGLGIVIDFSEVPKNPNYQDSTTKENRYVPYSKAPGINLIKQNDKWYFSRTTVAAVNDLYSRTFLLGTDKLDKIAEKANKGLGSKLIDKIGYRNFQLLLIALGVLVFVLTFWIVHKVLKSLLIWKFTDHYILNVANDVVMPFLLYLSSSLLILILPSLLDSSDFLRRLIMITRIVKDLLLIYFLIKAVTFTVEYLRAKPLVKDHPERKGLLPFLGMLFKIILVLLGILLVAYDLNVDMTVLLASLSIGGVAVALAAQDSIKNFIGSLTIFLDRPFKVGDWIMTEKISGNVEAIGLRSTRVRTFYDSLITIPNGQLYNLMLDNMGLRFFRRYKTTVRIKYSSTNEELEQFVAQLTERINEHPKVASHKTQIYLNDLGTYSVNILFYIFFIADDWTEELKYRHECIKIILQTAREVGVEIASPPISVGITEE